VRIRRSDLDQFLKSKKPPAATTPRKDRLQALEEQVAELAARVESLEQR
jgi:uncharacterized protein YceH (UPF0502 family)